VFALAWPRIASAQKKPDAALLELPLTWIAPAAPANGMVAVFLSGDGGWAELVRVVSANLSQRGIGVVGINSRAYLAKPRTPDETAVAVATAARAAMSRWNGNRIILVGYSRGADMLPFVANRLPADLRERVSAIVMFGLAPSASFEFHWSDLVKDTSRPNDMPILPELLRLRGAPMACVYGADEKVSGCRDAPDGLLTKEMRRGAHHFDGDPAALANVVLRLVGLAPVKVAP